LHFWLRPQDIGILGALGDSITAGTAAAATSMMDVFDESRGMSFITGADGHWQTNPTLGNVLNMFA
jgi:phospholipase B1, membrane-associated